MFAVLRYRLLRIALLGSLVASLCLVAVPRASANDRVPSGDLPFYAAPFLVVGHTADWASIPFYRPPSCIPPDFNLITLVDFPRAFSCTPPTTKGFEVWKDGAPVPWVWRLYGLGAVPTYFVRWSELQGAMADGVLTIAELQSLPSLLIGSASIYEQTVRNEASGGIVVVQTSSRGRLTDGRTFQVEFAATAGGRQSMHIVFR
jgi:hypothetical protein